jgi:hypothetical protein
MLPEPATGASKTPEPRFWNPSRTTPRPAARIPPPRRPSARDQPQNDGRGRRQRSPGVTWREAMTPLAPLHRESPVARGGQPATIATPAASSRRRPAQHAGAGRRVGSWWERPAWPDQPPAVRWRRRTSGAQVTPPGSGPVPRRRSCRSLCPTCARANRRPASCAAAAGGRIGARGTRRTSRRRSHPACRGR